MGENSQYHDSVSESLDINNEIIVPERRTPAQKRVTDPVLFDTSVGDDQEDKQPQEEKRVTIIPEEESISDARKDYRAVRGRLHQIAETGHQALEGILQVAEETEHPRAYEVVAQLVKSLTENTKQIMELHHDTEDLEEKKNKKKQTTGQVKSDDTTQEKNVTNNSIFVGSTAELQDMLDQMNSKRKDV